MGQVTDHVATSPGPSGPPELERQEGSALEPWEEPALPKPGFQIVASRTSERSWAFVRAVPGRELTLRLYWCW